MDLKRALLAPWMAAPVSMRWLIGSVTLLCALASLGLCLFSPFGDRATASVFVFCPAVGLIWVYLLPNTLLLYHQARDLCLPGVQRDVQLSLVLYAGLSTALPALLLGLDHAQVATATLVLGLTALVPFLYTTLPRVFSLFLCFLPLLLSNLHAHWQPAPPGEPGFTLWASPLAGALLLLAAYRWRRLTHQDVYFTGLMRPVVFGLNQNLRQLLKGDGYVPARPALDPIRLLIQRPSWLQPDVDLRHTGPQYRHRSLRVALGGTWLPERPWSRLRRMVLSMVFFIPLILIWVLVLHTSNQQDLAFAVIRADDALLIQIGLGIACWMVALAHATTIRRKWGRPNNEIPLLALLPGLGHGEAEHRHLLLAVVGQPLLQLLALGVLMVVLGRLAGLDLPGMIFLSLTAPACIAMAVADLLLTLGHADALQFRLLHWLVMPAGMVLTSLSISLPPHFHDGSILAPMHLVATWVLTFGWVVCLCGILWFAVAGWRLYQRQPHPYLICACY
ncbi:hypothetical protein [Oleiagrimonas sp.]|jgi:hypothetical protein|uniref:hypothetical protein n=1 Tax=Oleiagrimonas sp. TaxID=2010330 RepID=UPI00262B1D8E|nr:hypothetical protein [Oleiagrimonas sp.]MDA3913372.1 hypothetical protein [Oleiagrimonas sp.]